MLHFVRGRSALDYAVVWAPVVTMIPQGFETRGDSHAVLYSGHC